jgi:hypothetical protein
MQTRTTTMYIKHYVDILNFERRNLNHKKKKLILTLHIRGNNISNILT